MSLPEFYKNSSIYCIRSRQTEKIYVGSTTQKLSSRMATHRCDYKRFLKKKIHYLTSFEILKYDDAYIELIEKFPCNDIYELRKQEAFHIKNMNCINRYLPGRTQKQWEEENKDWMIKRGKIYREKNKESIAERGKIYREKNKEKLAERKKKYYEKNKEVLSEKYKIKYTCECGSIGNRRGKKRHEKRLI